MQMEQGVEEYAIEYAIDRVPCPISFPVPSSQFPDIVRGILTTNLEDSPYEVFKEADVIRLCPLSFCPRWTVEINTNDEYKCGRGHGTRAAAAVRRLFSSSGSGSTNNLEE
jgi:hypothetical protein